MTQFCLLVILFTAACVMSEDVEFHTCEMTWQKIGCFKDNVRGVRALPEQLFNIRDPKSKVYQPPRLDWTQLSDSWRSLACQCANATRAKGYKVFGLQFYGECWSGKNGTFDLFGKAKDEKCLMDLVFENNKFKWKHCEIASEQACVGQASTNYVYMLKEVPSSPGDGGWSEWGYWTQCDKTCGTGQQVRERTCTNPPPDAQGKDCEGPAEESRSCNLMECPIDGGFTPWEPFTDCTKSCGGGEQKFVRTCTNPPPQHGGNDCNGPREKIGPCNEFPCPTPCTRAVDLGVLLDATNSVGRKNFNTAKEFVLDLVNSMNIAEGASHLGLMVFNIRGKIIVGFNELDKQDPGVIKGILKNTIKLRGYTFTDKALRKAGEELFTVEGGERPDKPDVLVVLTDGKTNPAGEPYETALGPLKQKNVKVIAIGVGKKILPDELKRIAMGKKENVIHVSDFGKLFFVLQDVIDASCPQR